MDNIFAIKERILQLIKVKEYTIEEFCSKIEMSYANFRGKAKKTPINSTAIANIFALVPELNLVWLLTGSGNMLNNEPNKEITTDNQLIKHLKQEVKELNARIEELNREIGSLQTELKNISKNN